MCRRMSLYTNESKPLHPSLTNICETVKLLSIFATLVISVNVVSSFFASVFMLFCAKHLELYTISKNFLEKYPDCWKVLISLNRFTHGFCVPEHPKAFTPIINTFPLQLTVNKDSLEVKR